MTGQNKPGLLNLSPGWQSPGNRGVRVGKAGRRVACPFFFFFYMQGGLQWEKYQPHYGVGLSLPLLSMRGRGLSESTKGGKGTITDRE